MHIESIEDEVEFRRQISERAKQHFDNFEELNDLSICYKLLRYILTT